MKTTDDKDLFAHPLILGASVSAGYGTRDGGISAVLSRMINPHAVITNKAVSGATSVQSTAHLDLGRYHPSIVLGLDLFIWDAVRGETGKRFENNTRRLFDHFGEKNIPMIVGKLPVVDLPFVGNFEELKNNAMKVNEVLEKTSDGRTSILFDPLECLLTMESHHFLDGLHLSGEGNIHCAKYFLLARVHEKLAA